MGKLRLEPKKGLFIDQRQYDDILSSLLDARRAAEENEVYWDLDEVENPGKIRKEFMYVAEQEGLALSVRRVRNSRSLALKFEAGEDSDRGRMPAEESKKRILTALVTAERPLRKSEIVKYTRISPSTWNIRIKELLQEGSVKKKGVRRDTVYSIA